MDAGVAYTTADDSRQLWVAAIDTARNASPGGSPRRPVAATIRVARRQKCAVAGSPRWPRVCGHPARALCAGGERRASALVCVADHRPLVHRSGAAARLRWDMLAGEGWRRAES